MAGHDRCTGGDRPIERLIDMLVIAHRGASTVEPENTMSAFRRALALGADGIEFDVQLTRDGVPVVIHDLTLDRTTNGTGPVHEHDVASIERLRVRDVHSGDGLAPVTTDRFGERVPTLQQVLSLPTLLFELELKAHGDWFVDTVVRAVDTAGVLDRVEFTGGNPVLVEHVKRRWPDAVIGLFTSVRPAWMTVDLYERHIVGVASTSAADIVHVPALCVTPSIVDRLHALGKHVHANDAVDGADIARAVDSGADRLSCNDVALAVSLAHVR